MLLQQRHWKFYNGRNESIKNIISRYSEIPDYFPAEIDDRAIPFFIDWLIERVFFIEIVTANEQDAHKVFVTMNDRGLSLTPTEIALLSISLTLSVSGLVITSVAP